MADDSTLTEKPFGEDFAQTLSKIQESIQATPEEAKLGQAQAFHISEKILSGQFNEQDLLKENSRLAQLDLDLVSKLNQEEPLSRSESVALSILSVLPVVIGGIAGGKAGLAVGAQSGALGGTSLLKSLEAKDQRENKQTQAELAQVRKSRENLLDLGLKERERKLDLQDFETKEQIKKRINPSKSDIININNLPTSVASDFTDTEDFAVITQKALDFIDSEFPKETLDSLEGAKNLTLRKLAGNNPDSKAAQLQSILEEIILLFQEKKIKGNPSDKDVKRVEDVIKGTAPISNLNLVRNNLARLRDSSIRGMNGISRNFKLGTEVQIGDIESIARRSIGQETRLDYTDKIARRRELLAKKRLAEEGL